MKFLTYVESDTEACVIQGLLESCGIYSKLDYANIGGGINVVIGKSNLGVNIYVLEQDHERALEILSSVGEDMPDSEEYADTEDEEEL